MSKLTKLRFKIHCQWIPKVKRILGIKVFMVKMNMKAEIINNKQITIECV